MRILLAEDERSLSRAVTALLERSHYAVDAVYDGHEALDYLESGNYDALILDIMMPKMDGMEVLRRLRRESAMPVIMLTARDTVVDKVSGLDMGADDYVVKPFGVSELLARIRTTLRRADRINLSQGEQKDRYQVKDLVVDTARHQVFVGSEEIHFTQNEFKILELLCLHAGKVLTYDFILKHVWGPYEGSNNQILRVNMANIRRKLKENPSEPKYILTELGIGYRMLEDS